MERLDIPVLEPLQRPLGSVPAHLPGADADRGAAAGEHDRVRLDVLGDRLCELSGARWVYDTDPLQEIRRGVMTILTHHAASRQAAMAPYGHLLLSSSGG